MSRQYGSHNWDYEIRKQSEANWKREQEINKCCVYIIRCLANGNRYIGSTQNFKTRTNMMFTALRRNALPNSKMQQDFNVFGIKMFTLEPLVWCTMPELLVVERDAFERVRPEYNINRPGRPIKSNKNRPDCYKQLLAYKLQKSVQEFIDDANK